MADSMEGVVAEGEQPTTENVEQKTIAGMSHQQYFFRPEDALHVPLSLHQLHNVVAHAQDVSQPHLRHEHGLVQVPLPAC